MNVASDAAEQVVFGYQRSEEYERRGHRTQLQIERDFFSRLPKCIDKQSTHLRKNFSICLRANQSFCQLNEFFFQRMPRAEIFCLVERD